MLLLCIIIVFEIRKCDVFQVPAKVDLAIPEKLVCGQQSYAISPFT